MKRLCVVIPVLAFVVVTPRTVLADEPIRTDQPLDAMAETAEKQAESAPERTAPVDPPSPQRAYVAPGETERPHEPDETIPYVLAKPNTWFRFGLATRVGYASNEGLDPFTKTDVIGQVSLEVSRTLLSKGKTSMSLGLGWDFGGKATTARGATSEMTAHRVVVPIEGRYHLFPWLYGFAKVAPGVSLLDLTVKDTSAPTALSDLRPGFALDASAGASFLVIGHGAPERKRVRIWATPELGYGWTTSSRPNLTTDSREEVLGREEGASMAPVAVRGFFFRIGVGLTY
jgi:hypothetical protein